MKHLFTKFWQTLSGLFIPQSSVVNGQFLKRNELMKKALNK